MKGLALTSQENLFVCFNCSYSILILSSFFAFPCSSSCFCLISAYFQIIILNRYSNVTERESIHCWQRQVTTVWCSVIEHLCDIIIVCWPIKGWFTLAIHAKVMFEFTCGDVTLLSLPVLTIVFSLLALGGEDRSYFPPGKCTLEWFCCFRIHRVRQ